MDNLKYFKYFFDYMRDGDYPFFEKLLILLGLAYIVVPLDFLPDFLLPVGIIDDSVVLGAIVLWGGKILKNYFETTVEKRVAEIKSKQIGKATRFDEQGAVDDAALDVVKKSDEEEW